MFGFVLTTLYWVLNLYLLCLLGRAIIGFIPLFSPQWRPRGFMVIVAEVIFTATDPAIRVFRRFIPPVRLGAVQLDLAFTVVFLVVYFLSAIVGSLAARF